MSYKSILKLKDKFNIILKKYYTSIYKKKPWMKEIIKCQNEIMSLSLHPHYSSEYKKSEITYWLHIPEWIYEESAVRKVDKVLDIGCAYGTMALYCKRLFNCEIYCTDFIDTYLDKELVRKYSFIFELNNIEIDKFPWNVKYDVIIFTEVLEHLNFHPVPTLKKLYNLLSSDGTLYLSTPDASQWGRVTKYYSDYEDIPLPQKDLKIVDDHVYQYNKKELIEIINKAGFKIKRFRYSPGLLNRHFNISLIKSETIHI